MKIVRARRGLTQARCPPCIHSSERDDLSGAEKSWNPYE